MYFHVISDDDAVVLPAGTIDNTITIRAVCAKPKLRENIREKQGMADFWMNKRLSTTKQGLAN